jgi:hypothetical protein
MSLENGRWTAVTSALRFDCRDVASCARLGLSARKMWSGFKSLLLSWLVWDFFVYLGFLAAGEDMGARWNLSVLLPLPGGLFWHSAIAIALLAIGCILILTVLMRGSMKICRLAFEQIRGDAFYSESEASAFARGHSSPLILVPLMLAFLLVILLAKGAVLGLISRIPAAGPVLTALLALPLWSAMLLAVLTAAALILSIMLLPAIIASTKGDTFESVFELFSTMTSQSWRVFLYWLLSLLFTALGSAVFILFSAGAVGLLSMTTSWAAGGGGFAEALTAGPRMLAPELLPFFSSVVTLGSASATPAWSGAAGVLAGASGSVILLVLLSYVFSSLSSAWTVIYVGLRRRRDGTDLLVEADLEDMREYERRYGGGIPLPGKPGPQQEGQ